MKRYIRKLKCMICTINFPLLPPDMSCQKPRTNTDTDGSLRASVLESKESVLATFFANLSSVIHFCELLNNIISLPSFFRNYDRISDAAGSRWARMNQIFYRFSATDKFHMPRLLGFGFQRNRL